MENKEKGKYKNSFKTLIRLLSYFKGYSFLLLIVIILVIYTSFAQIYGTFMLKDIIANGIEQRDFNYTLIYTSIMALIYLLGALANLSYTQIMVRLSQRVIFKIREDLIKKVLSLPVSYFDKKQVGEIMSYFTNDVDSTINALNQSFANIIFSCCNIIGTILCMFLINVYLSLIATGIIAIIVIFITLNSKKCRKYYRKQQIDLSILNGCIEEDLRGIKVNKAFEHEDESYKKFEYKNEEWRKSTTSAFFHTQLNVPFIVSLSYLNFAICSIVGVLFLANGLLPEGIAALSPFLIYVRQSAQPFNFITQHINAILTALAGAERIFNYLDLDEEIDEGKVTLIRLNDNPNSKDHFGWLIPSTNEIKVLKGDIRFNNVTFGYNDKKIILNNISLYANPGEKIAFVGSTGAGKTTIISLISRFYEINSGEITYDGIDIKDIKKESLRRSISMVTQETHLFTGTIKENISYVRRHSTMEEIINASKIANADSFIKRLPLGYDTPLYDDGHNLSEGQRQLLALARAALSRPPILILDEATSNIDTHTEKLVQKSMNALMEDRTVLVIAHRLSTVRNSDAILCLEHGKIIERGTHEELLALKGYYYNLYKGKTELD